MVWHYYKAPQSLNESRELGTDHRDRAFIPLFPPPSPSGFSHQNAPDYPRLPKDDPYNKHQHSTSIKQACKSISAPKLYKLLPPSYYHHLLFRPLTFLRLFTLFPPLRYEARPAFSLAHGIVGSLPTSIKPCTPFELLFSELSIFPSFGRLQQLEQPCTSLAASDAP